MFHAVFALCFMVQLYYVSCCVCTKFHGAVVLCFMLCLHCFMVQLYYASWCSCLMFHGAAVLSFMVQFYVSWNSCTIFHGAVVLCFSVVQLYYVPPYAVVLCISQYWCIICFPSPVAPYVSLVQQYYVFPSTDVRHV